MHRITSRDTTTAVTVQARTVVAPGEAFAVIAPIELSRIFHAWGPLPGVVASEHQTGDWSTVGETRNPRFSDGSTADEQLTEITAPHSFAYEVGGFTGLLRLLVAGLRGEWTFTPDGTGTVIRWTYEFVALPGRRAVVRTVLAALWRRYATLALDRAVVAAERDTRTRLTSLA